MIAPTPQRLSGAKRLRRRRWVRLRAALDGEHAEIAQRRDSLSKAAHHGVVRRLQVPLMKKTPTSTSALCGLRASRCKLFLRHENGVDDVDDAQRSRTAPLSPPPRR